MDRVEQRTKLDLERIVFIGRTFEEYLDIFSLSKEELQGKKILDCPAGAVDELYQKPEIYNRK